MLNTKENTSERTRKEQKIAACVSPIKRAHKLEETGVPSKMHPRIRPGPTCQLARGRLAWEGAIWGRPNLGVHELRYDKNYFRTFLSYLEFQVANTFIFTY